MDDVEAVGTALASAVITDGSSDDESKEEGGGEEVLEEDWESFAGLVVVPNEKAADRIGLAACVSANSWGSAWLDRETVATVAPDPRSFPISPPYGIHYDLSQEEKDNLLRERELRSRVSRCRVIGCELCIAQYEEVYSISEGLCEVARTCLPVPPPDPNHLFVSNRWYYTYLVGACGAPTLRQFTSPGHFYENWVHESVGQPFPEDWDKPKGMAAVIKPLSWERQTGVFFGPNGVSNLGWATLNSNGPSVAFSRYFLMNALQYAQDQRVLGMTLPRQVPEEFESPIIKMANIQVDALRFFGSIPSNLLHDMKRMRSLSYMGLFRTVVKVEIARNYAVDLYSPFLHWLLPNLPNLGDAAPGECEILCDTPMYFLWMRRIRNTEETLAVYVLLEGGMGPWLLDVGKYNLFPQPHHMEAFLWDYMAARPGGWTAKGRDRVEYDFENDRLVGVSTFCIFFF